MEIFNLKGCNMFWFFRYKRVKLTQFQRENLKKLADYLLSGKLKAEFEMGRFTDDDNDFNANCGTIGCAVGHGPYAGIEKIDGEGWMKYSYRCLIDNKTKIHDNSWSWCFSGLWSEIDNTARGAGKRIQILLNKGLPKNWRDQMHGDIDLEYL
jgi:hypothetical protein